MSADRSPPLRVLFANAGWLAADKVLRALVGLWIGVWVARYLGPGQYGELAYLLAFVSFFVPVAQAGLDRIVVRDLSDAKANAREILGSAFFVRFAGSIVAMLAGVVSFALLHRAPDDARLAMFCVLVLSLAFTPFDVYDFWLQSRLRMRPSAIARNASFLVAVAVRAGLIMSGMSLFWFAAAVTVEAAITAAALYLLFRWQRDQTGLLPVSIHRCLSLFRESRYVIAYGLVVTVQARIDQLMLARLVGSEELGAYAAALRIVETLTFIPIALQTAMMPVVSQAKNTAPDAYRRQLLDLYRWNVLLFLPVGLALVLFSDGLVALLYDSAYASAGPLLALLAVRLLLAHFGIAKATFISNERLFALSFAATACGAVLNVVLNLWLVPGYGATGAVAASTASFFFTIFLSDLMFASTRRNFFLMLQALVTPWRVRSGNGR